MKGAVLICKPAPQVYVWIYDPVHFKTFAMGLILGELSDSGTAECLVLLLLTQRASLPLSVIAVIAATLFPLWPAEMRVGVYYLSVAAGCFVASILLLAVGE